MMISPLTMEFDSYYEIQATAQFICARNFRRVALQFPDELLKDSVKVVSSLRTEIQSLKSAESGGETTLKDEEVRLFMMADTTYGSCCVDEVGAAHIAADCVVHYGHTCLSPTSSLPAYFVFGKASIDVPCLAETLSEFASTCDKPLLVLYGLDYAYSIHQVKEQVLASDFQLQFADVMWSFMIPTRADNKVLYDGLPDADHREEGDQDVNRYSIGGLSWSLPKEGRVEDYHLFWIGSDGPAFANVVMTFNGCDMVRYDVENTRLETDFDQQKRILKRRYYLVEKAKDANIVGILVGTLGIAGYLRMMNQMKELITAAGKKAYTFVMGKPNPAKLANFPECDVFIYVSCAQTALLDSKEFLSPIITPFEATLAFTGGLWKGEYVMEFGDLIKSSSSVCTGKQSKEARFSFIQGGYVEDRDLQEEQENGDNEKEVLALVHTTEKALQLRDKHLNGISKGLAKSGAEYLAARSYTGLEVHYNGSAPETFVVGRTGRASGYEGEENS